MFKLTPRQAAVIEVLRTSIEANGYAPTVREIGEKLGIPNPNGVMCHIRALERKGKIRRLRHKTGRAIGRMFILL